MKSLTSKVFVKQGELRKRVLQRWFDTVGLKCSAFRALSNPIPELFVEMPEFIQDIIDVVLSNEKHLFIRGDLGSGKTTHMLLFKRELGGLEDNLGHGFVTRYVAKGGLHRRQIAREIADALGIRYCISWNSNRVLNAVEEFIRRSYPRYRTVLFFEDVAENTAAALREVTYLGDLEEDERLCTLIMGGTPECWSALEAVIPLLTSRCEVVDVPPFSLMHSREFVRKRLSYFSTNPKADDRDVPPFTEKAIRVLHKASEGNPRKLRGYCRRCESVAAERYRLERNEIVDEEIVRMVTSV